jgi:hypothetical protein
LKWLERYMCTEGGRSYYLIFFVRDLYVIMFHHDIERKHLESKDSITTFLAGDNCCQ